MQPDGHASDVPLEDTSVSLEDTWLAMEELVKQGYTRSIGLSNFNSQQIEKILKIATIKPVVNEVCMYRADGEVPALERIHSNLFT
jgi:diketogulonate reductase-like aldo/keto reductase